MIRRYIFGILLGSIICLLVGLTPADENGAPSLSQQPSGPDLFEKNPPSSLTSELAERYLPVGSGDILWLLKSNQTNFDVLARKLGKDWKWIDREISPANPHNPVAVGQKLHVFFEGGTHVFFSFPVEMPSGMSIGASTPGNVIAACQTKNFLSQVGPGLLIAIQQQTSAMMPFVKSPPAKKPSAQPMTGQGDNAQAIVIFQFIGSQWIEVARLAEANVDLKKPDAGISLAELENSIFLLAQSNEHSSLTVKEPGNELWRKLPTAFEEIPGRPIGLQVVKNTLICLFVTDEGFCQLGTFDKETGRFTSPQTLKLNDSPAKLGRDIRAAQLAEQLVLRWVEENKVKIATCSLTGSINSVEDIQKVIEEIPDPAEVYRLREYAVLSVVVIFVIMAFLIKPRSRTAIFVLPETLKPGNLLKRVIAFLLDFVPFTILGMAVFMPDMLGKTPDELRQMLKNPETFQKVELVYSQLLTLGLYIGYCIIMEMRYGATVGKMALKLKVVEADGSKPSLRSAVLRNITKAIELPMLAEHEIWFMMIIFMLPVITRYNQRLGDMVARSAVVDSREPSASPTLLDNKQPTDEQAESTDTDNPESPTTPPPMPWKKTEDEK